MRMMSIIQASQRVWQLIQSLSMNASRRLILTATAVSDLHDPGRRPRRLALMSWRPEASDDVAPKRAPRLPRTW